MADSEWAALLPRPVRELPADLAAVLLLTGGTLFVTLAPVVSETPLRIAFGLPFVLFLPGYALIAALFPEAGDTPDATDAADDETPDAEASDRGSGIDGIERVALSFGLSIAVVPLIGLVLNFTPFGIRLVPILVSVSLFTVVAAAVAARRRQLLPPDERFRVPYREWYAGARDELFEPDSRTDAALNVLLAVSILLAVSSVAYAVAVPSAGESFTEFYLLTETDDGELVADDYPTNFTVGQSKPVVVGVSNQEQAPVNYTVIAELQEVQLTGPNGTNVSVTNASELGRYSVRLGDNETDQRRFDVRPTTTGERLRLAFLLYRGEPPADPSVETAYRETHLWVNVTPLQG